MESENKPLTYLPRAGWSFGGVLAFEVSRQLRRLGREVKGVILIDSPAPIDHQALPQEVISYVVGKNQHNKKNVPEALKQARKKIDLNFQHHAMLLQNYHPQPQAGDVPCVMLKCSQVMDTEALCNVTYPWLSDADFRITTIRQWEQLIGRRIPVLDVDCNHFQVFDSEHVSLPPLSSHSISSNFPLQVQDVSEKLKLALHMLESPTT